MGARDVAVMHTSTSILHSNHLHEVDGTAVIGTICWVGESPPNMLGPDNDEDIFGSSPSSSYCEMHQQSKSDCQNDSEMTVTT